VLLIIVCFNVQLLPSHRKRNPILRSLVRRFVCSTMYEVPKTVTHSLARLFFLLLFDQVRVAKGNAFWVSDRHALQQACRARRCLSRGLHESPVDQSIARSQESKDKATVAEAKLSVFKGRLRNFEGQLSHLETKTVSFLYSPTISTERIQRTCARQCASRRSSYFDARRNVCTHSALT
jgi:hypothetical protein